MHSTRSSQRSWHARQHADGAQMFPPSIAGERCVKDGLLCVESTR
jgi:hypothetical protein